MNTLTKINQDLQECKRIIATTDQAPLSAILSDLRECKRYLATMDADSKQRWITTESGSHILVDKDGNIVAGAGGKFNGKPLSSMGGTKKYEVSDK